MTNLEAAPVRTVFDTLWDPANWEALLINFLAGLVVLAVTYMVVERVIDWRKEPARKKLFNRLVREALFIASSCDRVVSYKEEGLDVDAPVLNDRFTGNLGWSYMSTIQFNEQLSLFSGTLDHRKVEHLSCISSTVSKARVSLNTLRQFDGAFTDSLDFYAPNDPEHAQISEAARVPPGAFRLGVTEVLGKDYCVISDLNEYNDRESNWRIYFAIGIHNLLWDATRLCLYVEDFSKKFHYSMDEVEKELQSEGLDVFRISDRKDEIEEKRKAILKNGLYLVKHVIRPTTVTPRLNQQSLEA